MAVLLAFGGLFFAGVLFGRVLVHSDFHLAFEPLRTLLGRALRDGFPLWTPALGNGEPLLANPFAQALYPPNLAFLLPFDAARILSWLVIAHVLFGAVGALLLARRLGRSPAASLLAGLVFGFGGVAASATFLVLITTTLTWVPWLLLAFESASSGRNGRGSRLLLGAATAAGLLAGDPFVTMIALLSLVAFALSGEPGALRRNRARWGAIALGALVASPAILAAAIHLSASGRGAGFPSEWVTEWSLPPAELLSLTAPRPFGVPFVPGGYLAASLEPEQARPLIPDLYVGPIVLALAAAGLRRRRRELALATLALVALLLALGRYGPIYPLISGLGPIAGTRFPAKWIVGASLPIALLAAAGLDALRDEPGRARRASVTAAAFLGAMMLLGAFGVAGGAARLARLLVPGAKGGEVAPLADAIASSLAWCAFVAAAGLLAVAVSRRRPRLAAAALVLVPAIDLLAANRSLAPTVSVDLYREEPAVMRLIDASPPVGRVRVGWPFRPELPRFFRPTASVEEYARFHRQALSVYVGAARGMPLAFEEHLEVIEPVRYSVLRALVDRAPWRESLMLLGAAGVTHVVLFEDPAIPWLEPVGSVDVGSVSRLRVFRNRLALPRARVVGRLVPFREPAELAKLLPTDPDDFFSGAALVEADAFAEATAEGRPAGGAGGGGAARILVDRAGRIVIETTGSGGWLVLSDTLTPGWRATVDGRPERILPVDAAFRGVPVPSGTHRVEMDYSPWRR